MSSELIPMTMGEFLRFLRRHCESQVKKGPCIGLSDSDKNFVYESIAALIDAFLRDYGQQKKKSKEAEAAFLESIDQGSRREFDDPIDLIKHIREIAVRPGFLDNEKISLSVIAAFCNDYINRYNVANYMELKKQAPF